MNVRPVIRNTSRMPMVTLIHCVVFKLIWRIEMKQDARRDIGREINPKVVLEQGMAQAARLVGNVAPVAEEEEIAQDDDQEHPQRQYHILLHSLNARRPLAWLQCGRHKQARDLLE